MKYTKKLILVPSERYAELQKCMLQDHHGPERSPEGKIDSQLMGKGADNPESKQSASMNLVEGPPQTGQQPYVKEKTDKHEGEDSTALKAEHIVASMGKPYRSKTKNLLDYLKQAGPGTLNWTSLGELVHKGQPIHGSNIIDLFRSSMHNVPLSLNMPGESNFKSILHELNAPLSLLGNKRWREGLAEKKGFQRHFQLVMMLRVGG